MKGIINIDKYCLQSNPIRFDNTMTISEYVHFGEVVNIIDTSLIEFYGIESEDKKKRGYILKILVTIDHSEDTKNNWRTAHTFIDYNTGDIMEFSYNDSIMVTQKSSGKKAFYNNISDLIKSLYAFQ